MSLQHINQNTCFDVECIESAHVWTKPREVEKTGLYETISVLTISLKSGSEFDFEGIEAATTLHELNLQELDHNKTHFGEPVRLKRHDMQEEDPQKTT